MPPTIRTSSSTAELTMSAPTRPSATDALPIGMERNRSVMPLRASLAIAVAVVSTPNIMLSASMPGSRKLM
jgi:hypothetical protein